MIMMSKNTNKNEVATVNTTTEVVTVTPNNEKTNKVLSLDEVKKLFIECGITPKYTDNTNYIGCGTKSNTFSVNVKKTKYNIYCNNDNFTLVNALKLKNTLCVENGNSVDKTRPNYIECKSTDELKKMLQIVLKNNSKIALVK